MHTGVCACACARACACTCVYVLCDALPAEYRCVNISYSPSTLKIQRRDASTAVTKRGLVTMPTAASQHNRHQAPRQLVNFNLHKAMLLILVFGYASAMVVPGWDENTFKLNGSECIHGGFSSTDADINAPIENAR